MTKVSIMNRLLMIPASGRSTSPSTMSIVPISATTSATRCPSTIRLSALEIAKRRRPNAEAVRIGRLAVADDEESELAFRRLDSRDTFRLQAA